MQGIEVLGGRRRSWRRRCVHPLGLDEGQRGCELAHAEVQSRDVVVGLAVVAIGAREVEHVVATRDEYSALPGRDRLRRVKGVHAGVAPRPRAPPGQRAPWACAQSSIRKTPSAAQRSAISRTSKATWPPMCTRTAALGWWRRSLASKSGSDAHRSSRLQSTKTGRPPRAEDRERRGHEGVRGAQHRLAAHAGEFERRQRAARPRPGREPRRAVQAAHAASKRRVISPSDDCSESMTSSQSACRRTRSRRSKPMAKRESSWAPAAKALGR